MRKARRIILTILATILLLIGLVLIFNEPIKGWLVQMNQENKIAKISPKSIEHANKSKGDFDFSKVKSIDMAQIGKSMANNTAQTLGVLAIPSVKMRLPILKGLSDAALSSGGGTMRPDQKMGQGNYPLAGHYMTNKGILFSPIERAQIGQKVYLTDLKKVYTYKIYYKKVVNPYAVWLVNNTKKKMVTLITCANGGINRWAIRGKLVKTQKATAKTLKIFDLEDMVK